MVIDLIIQYLSHTVTVMRRRAGVRRIYIDMYAQRIANDEFVRMEQRFAQSLHRLLPQNGYYSVQECLREVRLWAIEAAHRFDPDYATNNTFSTFLWKHLQMQCMKYRQSAWRSNRYPQNGKWLTVESSLNDWDFSAVSNDEPVTEPDDEDDYSDETRAILDGLASDQTLIDLARSPYNRKRLSERSGFTREAIERAFAEVRAKGLD